MKVFKLLIALFITSNCIASEQESSLDSYLSDLKQKSFELDHQKNEAESLQLRDSWIAPINVNYNYTKSNPFTDEQTNEDASVQINQPIFQSGGIYYGIKFAQNSQKYAKYSIDVAKRKLIKDVISLLMQIKQTGLKIAKQKLQIKNSDINLEQKKQDYLSGQLDSGFLDQAIIDKNTFTQILYDIQTSKQRLISQFNSLSDLDYKKTSAPELKMLEKDEFLNKNLVVKMMEYQEKKDMYANDVRVAKYLPKVSFTAGYNWTKTDSKFTFSRDLERDYYNYGLRAQMPIDLNTFRDIESSRVDYLKSQILKKDKIIALEAIFEQVIQNIQNLDKKITLSLENKELYNKLLSDTKEFQIAGYKTSYDVQTLQNSSDMADMDVKIYKIDKQLELLVLYEMYDSE